MTLFRACLASFLGAAFLGAQSLTIYTEISPPDQFTEADGPLTGFGVEVVRDLQHRVGNTDPIQVVPWVRGYAEFQAKPNVAIFCLARTAERDPLFHWIGPIRESVFNFYVKADSQTTLRSLAEARKLPLVGVYKDDVKDLYLTRMGFKNLDRSLDEVITFKKLMDGRVAAMAGSAEGHGGIAAAAGYKPEDVRPVLTFLKVQIYIGLSKGTAPAVLKQWSSAMKAMRKDGSLERIHGKYYPGLPLPGPAFKPD